MTLRKGVIYPPSIKGFKVLDTDYFLTLGGVTYSVGNGMTLVDTPDLKSLVWVIDTNDFEVGTYKGVLKSQSSIYGIYLRIEVELNII